MFGRYIWLIADDRHWLRLGILIPQSMQKILVLTDFSEASRNALAYARSFFSDTLVDFHLLSIYPAETDGFYGLKHNDKTARITCIDQLNTIVAELSQQAANDWHTFRSSALPGHPLEVVEKAIEADVYDLVVIGPHTTGTNELFGNSAIALVHRLKANVLVVPTGAQATLVYQIVLAADFANLKNAKILGPLKDIVTLKEALLTLLTIDSPDKTAIHPQQEAHIRTFLHPIKPTIVRLEASSPKAGIDAYLAEHPVDLLVTIPRFNEMSSAFPDSSIIRTQAYTPPVPLLTLYDDGSNDLPHELLDELANVDYTL